MCIRDRPTTAEPTTEPTTTPSGTYTVTFANSLNWDGTISVSYTHLSTLPVVVPVVLTRL